MDPEEQNILKQAWNEVSTRVRDVLLAQTHQEVIQKAVSGFNVDSEGVSSLEQEVLFVLLGLQTINEFENEISLRSVLSTQQSREFVKKIQDELFAGLISTPQDTGASSSDSTRNPTTIHTAIDAYGLVRERLERLPQSVQTVIRSQEMESGLASLLGKYALGKEHTPVFVAEAVRVMVGLTTTNNFKMEVTRATGLNPNTLDALFFDAESTLFKPVRMAIMQALEQRGSVTNAPTPPMPSKTVDPYRVPIQ